MESTKQPTNGKLKASNKFLIFVFLLSSLYLITHKFVLPEFFANDWNAEILESDKMAISSLYIGTIESTVIEEIVEEKPKVSIIEDCLSNLESVQFNNPNKIDIALITKVSDSFDRMVIDKICNRNFKYKKYQVYSKNHLKDCPKAIKYSDLAKEDFTQFFDYIVWINHEIEHKVTNAFKGERHCLQSMSVAIFDTQTNEKIYSDFIPMNTQGTSFVEGDNNFLKGIENEVSVAADNIQFPNLMIKR